MRFYLDCMMCGRRRRVSFVQWALGNPVFCPAEDVSGCIATYKAATEDPPEDEPEDPESLPPEDWLECESCHGTGEVFVRQDWQTGALDFEECRTCVGTGSAVVDFFDGKVWSLS